jgi:hypothetical protein
MDQWPVVVVLTVLGLIVLKLIVLLIICRGDLARLGLAIRFFYKMLADPALAARVPPLLLPPEPPKPPKRSGESLRLLALLQREGRVLDFFLEDIEGASDEQIGAGVRELQKKAQGVIKERLVLEPVLPQNEGDSVEVPRGFDASAIRVTGNVSGQPPFHGRLVHRGWRVKDFNLSAPPPGHDEFVVAPAEVELP